MLMICVNKFSSPTVRVQIGIDFQEGILNVYTFFWEHSFKNLISLKSSFFKMYLKKIFRQLCKDVCKSRFIHCSQYEKTWIKVS